MKIRLLEPHGNLPAGRVWNHPWASVARALIRKGIAEAVEDCDRRTATQPRATRSRAK